MFNISCNLLNAKDRMVLSAPMVYPRDYVLTGGSDLPPMPSITREYHMHVGCPEKKKKKPNSESEVQFLLNTNCFFTIIKRKNC